MQQKTVVRGIIQNGPLILLRQPSNNEVHSNALELPGGNIEIGDSPEATLTHKLSEQIGIQFTTFSLRSVYSYTQNDSQVIGIIYDVICLDVDTETLLSLGEQKGYVWFDIRDIDKLQLSDETIVALGEIGEYDVAKNTHNITEVKLYTDVGLRGNPGPSALGYVVMDSNDNVVTKSYKYLGITTNNQAEYQAVKAGLQYCAEQKYHKVSVYLDSQLVANQMNGVYKIKNRDLWPIHESIKQLIKVFKDGVQFTYIPREYNTDADEMVNTALDEFESNKH